MKMVSCVYDDPEIGEGPLLISGRRWDKKLGTNAGIAKYF